MKSFFFNNRTAFLAVFTLMFNLFSVSLVEAGTQPVKEKKGLAKIFAKKAPTIDSVARQAPVQASASRPSCVPPKCQPTQVVRQPRIIYEYEDVVEVIKRPKIIYEDEIHVVKRPVIEEVEEVFKVPVYIPEIETRKVVIPVYVVETKTVPVSVQVSQPVVYAPAPQVIHCPPPIVYAPAPQMVHCPPPVQRCPPVQQVRYSAPAPRTVYRQPCPPPRQYVRHQQQYRQPCPPPEGYRQPPRRHYAGGGHPGYGGGFNFNPVNINQGNNIMYRSGGNHNPNAGLGQAAVRHALAQGGMFMGR